MKIPFLIPLLLIFSVAGYAQIPQAFNYQAVIRDTSGEIQKDMEADFQIDILLNGSLVYSEEHKDENTGSIGIVNFKIGTGDTLSGDFSNINWADGQHELVVRLDGQEIGTSEIVAVPFALYAQNSGDSHWFKQSNDIFYDQGRVGIGTKPINTLTVNGLTNLSHPFSSTLLKLRAGGSTLGTWISSFDESDTSRMWTIKMGERNQNDRFEIITSNNKNALIIDQSGRIGIGTKPVNTFTVKGLTNLSSSISSTVLKLTAGSSSLGTRISSFEEDGTSGMWTINMGDRNNGNRFGIYSLQEGENKLWIDHADNTHVRVLQIHGGGDIKEDINSVEMLEPGDVVVIDEKNPGNIRRTNIEYDKKVAGVISGANGVKPGLSLSQDDVLTGDYPLAMLGRVYVKVIGGVEVGDMLTTSTKPGYAISVKDFSKANGTVIGKAMSKNESGEGVVLVLINLQ